MRWRASGRGRWGTSWSSFPRPTCAAYKRPQSLLDAFAQGDASVPEREVLERTARGSLAQRRLVRIDGAEHAKSGQATCRHCRERIERGVWRIRLVYFEEGRFVAGGYIHLSCRGDYFETADVFDHVLQFSAGLSAEEREELQREMTGA